MPGDLPRSQRLLADPASLTAEERRLQEARAGVPWRGWGRYKGCYNTLANVVTRRSS